MVIADLWPATEIGGLSGVAGIGGLCAYTDAGEVWCWGWHAGGSAGTGSREYPYDRPVQAVGVTDAVQVEHANTHTCLRHETGSVSCVGENSDGELGDGTLFDRLYFTPVVGTP